MTSAEGAALPAEALPGGGRLDVLAAGILPGALAGAQLAGLLFFLNPSLPFSAGPLLRAALAYGALLGAAGLAAVLPWTWGRPARARRLLPWTLTAAFAFAAVLDWTHASHYAYFLPAGINDRLIKTAMWLTLAALFAFYTALLHTLTHRPYGRRSRGLLAVLALLSLFAVVERRHAFRPRPEPRPAALPAAAPEPRPRLVVVALEGATLDAILPLAGDGRLPFFATLLKEGAYGRLASLTPHRPTALWTSIATGKYPYKHGVTGDPVYTGGLIAPGERLRLLPTGIGFAAWGRLGARPEPAGGGRTASALWELLPRLGVPAGLVGWPGSSPAPGEPVFALTDRFFREARETRGAREAAPRPPPGSGRPEEIAARARLFRVAPEELDPLLLARFGPAVDAPLRRALAADLWRESLGLDLLGGAGGASGGGARALFLALPGLEGVSRRSFGGFSVVQFEAAKARVYREAAQVVTAYYEHLDEFLGELWKRHEEPAILAVVSAYGVEGPGRWRRLSGEMSREAAVGGTTESSPDGILLLYGDGIRKGSLLTEADLVDVAPTLLYALGYPVPRDLDGKVLTAAFDRALLTRRPLTFVSSYERP